MTLRKNTNVFSSGENRYDRGEYICCSSLVVKDNHDILRPAKIVNISGYCFKIYLFLLLFLVHSKNFNGQSAMHFQRCSPAEVIQAASQLLLKVGWWLGPDILPLLVFHFEDFPHVCGILNGFKGHNRYKIFLKRTLNSIVTPYSTQYNMISTGVA